MEKNNQNSSLFFPSLLHNLPPNLRNIVTIIDILRILYVIIPRFIHHAVLSLRIFFIFPVDSLELNIHFFIHSFIKILPIRILLRKFILVIREETYTSYEQNQPNKSRPLGHLINKSGRMILNNVHSPFRPDPHPVRISVSS